MTLGASTADAVGGQECNVKNCNINLETEEEKSIRIDVERDDDDDDDDEDDDEDDFDVNGVSLPRLSSSTIPIVVEVSNAHKTPRFYSNSEDPLFQGVCLFSTATTKSTTPISLSADASDTSSSTLPSATATTENDENDKEYHPVMATETFKPSLDTAINEEYLFLWDVWFLPAVFRNLWLFSKRWGSKA
mmetsp:Transcript_24180/g.44969  ORF Transcript_24180/g.44969 Transcript_24180/m.44969 type:complete len:190 (+) Transcript_24180:262-831(+)